MTNQIMTLLLVWGTVSEGWKESRNDMLVNSLPTIGNYHKQEEFSL